MLMNLFWYICFSSFEMFVVSYGPVLQSNKINPNIKHLPGSVPIFTNCKCLAFEVWIHTIFNLKIQNTSLLTPNHPYLYNLYTYVNPILI